MQNSDDDGTMKLVLGQPSETLPQKIRFENGCKLAQSRSRQSSRYIISFRLISMDRKMCFR